jgi:hypothetical protein
MQIGQAAGAAAALSRIEGRPVRRVSIRSVQAALLDAGCYIMPYLDLQKDDPHFKALQKIGATGILRGEGRNVGWANETWFRAGDPLLAEDIFKEDYHAGALPLSGPVKVGQLLDVLRGMGVPLSEQAESWWVSLGLTDFDPGRVISRLEAAVVIDAAVDPFAMFDVDYDGNVI